MNQAISRRSRSKHGPLMIGGGLIAAVVVGCGFGVYDDNGMPNPSQQWWPWACSDGTSPRPPTAPKSYTASGSCGAGGPLMLSVNGCVVSGSWSVLGLSNVQTTQPASDPTLGGWTVTATGPSGPQSCAATQAGAGVLTISCSQSVDGGPPRATCHSTLAPMGG